MTHRSLRFPMAALLVVVSSAPVCRAQDVRLVQFSSPSCGPCRQMRPLLRQMAAENLQVQEIDVTRDPQLAARYEIEALPTFVVLVDGQERGRAVGARPLRDLKVLVQDAVADVAPVDPIELNRSGPATYADNTQPQSGRIVTLESTDSAAVSPRRRALANRLLAASVRISVEDAEGKSRGTGTIVDARSGEALILTCGHIFRESQGKGPIVVTLFSFGANGAVEETNVEGQIVAYDLERDLGLITMRPAAPVKPVRIAVSDNSQPGTPVTTVGCNRGANPTVIHTKITAVNRFQGPPNIEAAGAPIEGRSGGGLFNAEGELIGVCFAADPQGDEGLYAALDSIHAKLDSCSLSMIYRSPSAESASPVAAIQRPWPVIEGPPAPVAAAAEPSSIRGQEPFADRAIPVDAAALLADTEPRDVLPGSPSDRCDGGEARGTANTRRARRAG